MQKLAEQVEPIGDNRADMRDAANTVRILQALGFEFPSGPDAEAEHLRNYLPVNQPAEDDDVLTPEEAAELKRRRAENEQ